MAEDEKDVQKEEVSEETKSTETETEDKETKTEEEVKPQYLTKEDIQQMLADEREKIKQSTRDISRSQIESAQRGATSPDDIAGDYEASLGDIDPEQRNRIKAEAELKGYKRREREASQSQLMVQAQKDFEGSLTELITGLGLDPDDKRLDWARDLPPNSPGYFNTRQGKIFKSIASIQKEEAKIADGKRSEDMKDLENRLRKEFSGDSVDTSASGGASGSDADFQKKFNAGDIPATKANLDRINKIMSKE